ADGCRSELCALAAGFDSRSERLSIGDAPAISVRRDGSCAGDPFFGAVGFVRDGHLLRPSGATSSGFVGEVVDALLDQLDVPAGPRADLWLLEGWQWFADLPLPCRCGVESVSVDGVFDLGHQSGQAMGVLPRS